MDVRILGRLEVVDDGRTVPLGGARQRALLAILVLRRGEIVSADRLVEDLYDGKPPPTAAKSLQAHVSRLRKALGPASRLRTEGGGYVLDLADGELDAERFASLLADGRAALASDRAAEAATCIEHALALWRGAPLSDLSYASFAQGEIARLEELHLNALEDLVAARLALGDGRELVGELERLVAEHPLRERLRALLLLALYRSGRQAEALESYQAARSALVEGLGVEPGRELRELHQAILNQDPGLDAPVTDRSVREDGGEPSPRAVRREARKTVTALFAALRVSSDAGGLDPEALRRVTRRALAEVEAAAGRHGGTIENAGGETICAVFGLPVVHEDDALRGVRAAVEARDLVAGLAGDMAAARRVALELRVGLGTGEAITGTDAERIWATGEPLTRSSALGRAAAAGEILADAATARLVRGSVVAEPAGDAWRIVGLADTGYAGRLSSPMVGRGRERRRLHDAFEQAVGDRSCQLFTVLGAAGVGKSRLVGEFLADLTGRAAVVRGRCLPYGEGITYWPLLEAIREAVGLDDAASPEEGRALLARMLESEQGAEALAQRVSELIGLSEGGGSVDDGFRAVQALFEAVAARRPLVLLFDDIHWGEPTFLDLVEHLAERVRDAPLLLVCLARPELLDVRPGWGGGKLNATTALLEPLSDAECAVLIENLLNRSELTGLAETRIAEAAEGNPLFVEEMLSMLIDDGLLVRDEERWVPTAEIAAVRIPPTIHALLAARLDRLPEEERAVIERAAVAGKVFYEDAVAELAPEGLRSAVEGLLDVLVRKELIRPQREGLGGATYRFRHLLIRDAAYESIPKELRAELHERFGRWLERTAGSRATEYEEVVGYHFEQAFRYRSELGAVEDADRAIAREAAERLGSAGRRAFDRSDARAGVNLVSRAVALLPADDPLRVELVPNVRAVQGIADLGWAESVLTEAVEAAATSGNRRLAANALVQRGFLRLFAGREVTPAELIDVAERAIAVFDDLGDDLGLARAWRLVAQADYLARDLAACEEASERALAHVRRDAEPFEEREIVEWLVIALLLGPAPAARAAERCRRLLEETARHPVLQSELLGALALLATMDDRQHDADELISRVHTSMEDVGEPIWIVSFWLSIVHLWRDDPAAAERELRPGYEALQQIGERSHFSSLAHALAAAAYGLGRDDEAHELTRQCEQASRANDVHSQILWRAIRAKVFARRGDLEQAEALSLEAVDLASRSDFVVAHADALLDRAEVLELGGDGEGSDEAIREAILVLERKGNRFQAERARARLAGRSR